MMRPDYNELANRQQKDYQSSRDPFEFGQQVAQRRFSEMMSNLDMQGQATQQSYGDLYNQARQRAVGGSAMGGPTLSGGMGQQQRDFVSAIEMQELGRIGQAREGASRDLFSQGQAAFSNAQLEGQQATQMQLGNQQTQLQLLQQRQEIVDSNLPEAQKQAQLDALGAGNLSDYQTPPTALQTAMGIAVPAGGAALYFGASAATKVGTGAIVKTLAADAAFKQLFIAFTGQGIPMTTATLKTFVATKDGAIAYTRATANLFKGKGIAAGSAKFATLGISGGKLAALKGVALVGFKVVIPAALLYFAANAITKAATGKTIIQHVRG